MSIARS